MPLTRNVIQPQSNGAFLMERVGHPTFAGDTRTIASASTPLALVTSSTPCHAVWIGAPNTGGVGGPTATNTAPAYIGDVTNQNIALAISNFEGYEIAIDDAAKIYIKVGVNGETVFYRILT